MDRISARGRSARLRYGSYVFEKRGISLFRLRFNMRYVEEALD